MSDDESPRVVVGVDGSDHGDLALRFAVAEAARRGARVVAVSAWDPPIETLGEYYGIGHYDEDKLDAVHERSTRDHVDRVVTGWPGTDGVPIEVHARTGRPADILVEAARGADLLVVGRRGRGGPLHATPLGSVGLAAVVHASCPVLVVPAAVEPR
jgi:nucleotide-binding universal stress UspA family protein